VRRHRAAARAVVGVFALASLLLLVAAVRWATAAPRSFSDLAAETVGRAAPSGAPDPTLLMALWIGVAFLALGAIYFRRAMFAPLRLRAVGGLRGHGGLLMTLYKTTVAVALIGASVALIGFASSLMTGLLGDMLRAWLIAAAVLAYAYPRLGAWRRVVESADEAGAGAEPAAKGTFA
jgi:hypothetical protein